MIAAVLFDLDNTLYDRDAAFAAWAKEFVAQEFGHCDNEGRESAHTALIRMDRRGKIPRAQLFLEVTQAYNHLPYAPEELCERFYREWLVHMALEDGVVSALDALERAGVPIGVVTNGPPQQELKIGRLGLRRRTTCVFISELFGAWMPDPSIFLAAAAHLGVDPALTLFVGDDAANDVVGAQAAGMQTAWLARGETWPADLDHARPDWVLGSLAELARIVSAGS